MSARFEGEPGDAAVSDPRRGVARVPLGEEEEEEGGDDGLPGEVTLLDAASDEPLGRGIFEKDAFLAWVEEGLELLWQP